MFRKVLVANRGEIAVRVIRALHEMGIGSVAVYSDLDRAALHVRLAGEASPIGSYLSSDDLIAAARLHQAEAIHPGYGFLSENAEFAAACRDSGLVFIGPPAESIRIMGLKTEARRAAIRAGVPVVPGTESPVVTLEEAIRVASALGYPVMLKAAAGGGGKGMRRVSSPSEMESAFRDASSEAERAFASGAVYLEKLIVAPRHIEIQILGDAFGNIIHLGERECSLQRRHQKVIEECPSPFMSSHPELRHAMGEAAVRVARAAGYANAGTVEFLTTAHGEFYFLEMNTRLQVEHPVTELVTGIDLVHWQLRLAAGEPLTLRQEDISWRGSAIECRVCAEDPDRGFLPSPGLITDLEEPSGPGVRVDSGVYSGWRVPVEYDPLLAKLIVWAPSRATAIERMRRAVREYAVTGISANLDFFGGILDDANFRAGDLHTGFIEDYFKRRVSAPWPEELEAVAALAAMSHASRKRTVQTPAEQSRWSSEGRERLRR